MNQQPRLPLWFLVVNCSLIAIAFLAGVFLGSGRAVDFPDPQDRALQSVYHQIMTSHVDVQDGAQLLDRAIGAMARVDDYSRYVPPSKVEQYEEATTGRYEGIGLVFRLHSDELVTHFPYADGPAERAGIRPGDRLVSIDGTAVADIPSAERSNRAVELIRGPEGSTVAIEIRRADETMVVQVERAGVQRPIVKWGRLIDPERGLGYVHFSDFHRGLTAALGDEIEHLRADARAASTSLRGLIVDLRWNGGGNFDECLDVARMFQPTGVIVSTRRRGEELERAEADASKCRYPDLPLVLLVNGDSASASEVLAGCLQDHDRAAIVGTRTYGKGVVNTVYSWSDYKLKLTTAHYYTPKGRSLGGSTRPRSPHGGTDRGTNGGANGTGAGTATEPPIGIAPDIVTELNRETAQRIRNQLRRLDVPRAHREAFAAVAAEVGIAVPNPPDPGVDTQLATALERLRTRVDAASGTNGADK